MHLLDRSGSGSLHAARVTIRPIDPSENQAALDVMLEVALELWGLDLDVIRQYDSLSDYADLLDSYPATGGAFLVAVLDSQPD